MSRNLALVLQGVTLVAGYVAGISHQHNKEALKSKFRRKKKEVSEQ